MSRKNAQALTLLTVALATSQVHAQHAADAYYDPAAMAASRAALKAHHGNQLNSLILGERFEHQSNEGDPTVVWEAQGWLGGDVRKLWVKSEGEFESDGGQLEDAEIQVLGSRAISPFWDLQAGIRHDITPNPSRTYAAFGLQGLAPYWFEVDAALFLSNQGDVSIRLEGEYDFRLTQRLLLQPRIEFNAAFSSDTEIGLGTGANSFEAGLRLRYEVARKFAPYVGVNWIRALGDTADLKRADNEGASQLSWVAGIRFWF